MIRHYFHMALRSLRRQGIYAWINIAGLAVGITVFTLIALYVLQEMSIDRFHPGVERAFRIDHARKVNDRELLTPFTPAPLAPRVMEAFQGVESACRVHRATQPVAYQEQRFREEGILYVDPSFTDVFSVRFLAGDGRSALSEPNSVVLTEETARKYFADEPPVGKSLTVGGESYEVTGIVEDISRRSHLDFDFLASFSSLADRAWMQRWSAHNAYTYVKVRPGHDASDLERQLAALVEQELGPMFAEGIGKSFPEFLGEGQRFEYFLQPMAGIHLDSHTEFELEPNGDRRLVASLVAVALLILLIACMNYVNLATARASRRVLEVGMRKTLGAERTQLVTQFLFEALLTTLAAGALAAVFLAVLWKAAATYLDGEVMARAATDPRSILAALGGLGILALLSGAYPAFVLSSFYPVSMLKRSKGQGAGGRGLRRTLVVFQFTIAIALLATTLIVDRQMRFLSRKDLGFQPAGVLAVNGLELLEDRWEAFKQEGLRIPGVVSASAASTLPGRLILEGYLYPGTSTRQEDLVTALVVESDADFAKTLGIRVVEGESFSAAELEAKDGLLVNAMVPERLGWPAPLGKLVTVGHVPATIRGVIGNVYLKSLHQPPLETVIRPLVGRPKVLAVRIEEGRTQSVVPQLAACWKKFAPDQPFDTTSLDQEIAASYEPERRLMRVISAFTLVAVFLACLGIAGLSAFVAEQRVREIGIRKALGATAGQVTFLLTREFLALLALALAAAAPFAWYASHRWLEGFALRAEIPWWLFPAAGTLIAGVALATVGLQALRAAVADPAKSLRYE